MKDSQVSDIVCGYTNSFAEEIPFKVLLWLHSETTCRFIQVSEKDCTLFKNSVVWWAPS
jgi:hypothetical protein